MRIPEILVEILIWLPTLIAFARGSTYRWLIPLVSGAIALTDYYDLAKTLSQQNARHSAYLFAGEALAWMLIFILSIVTAERRKPEAAG